MTSPAPRQAHKPSASKTHSIVRDVVQAETAFLRTVLADGDDDGDAARTTVAMGDCPPEDDELSLLVQAQGDAVCALFHHDKVGDAFVALRCYWSRDRQLSIISLSLH